MKKHGGKAADVPGRVQGRGGTVGRRQPEEHRRDRIGAGLGETALRLWVQQAEVDAGRGPAGALTTSEREELTHLRRENQRLRMEREILKKRRCIQ